MEEASVNRKVQFFVALAVSIAGMTSGVSVYWSTPTMPKFHNNETGINITEGELSWMAAMTSPGIMTGSLLTSFTADKFGRRPTLLASAAPIITGTVLLVCANKPWMLYITRFLWGCGVGLYVTVASIYLVEIADKDIRGTISVGNRFMFNLGSFLVMVVGPFVLYQTLSYMLLALPLIYFVACWWIPETPYCLLKEGKVVQAKEVLSKLRGFEGKVLEDQLSLMQSNVQKEMRRKGTVKELFTGRQYRKAIVISVGLKMTQILAGSIPILQYLGRIMQESNTDIPVSTALIIFGAVRFIVGIFSSMLVDKVGRRPLLILSYIGSSIFLAIVGTYFYFQEVIGIDNERSNSLRYITFIGIVLANVISTMGFDSLVFVIPAEIFPINIKSKAMTALNIFGGCLSFMIIKGYQEIKEFSGLYGVFWFFGSAALLGGIFSYFVVPETKGKSLAEIQMELQGLSNDDSSERLNNLNGLLDLKQNKDSEMKELSDVKSDEKNGKFS